MQSQTGPLLSNADISSVIAQFERNVDGSDVTELARLLANLDPARARENGDLFAPPRSDRYSRRLIWEDPKGRFIVVGMTWLPGQASPLHDHAGLWGTELVVQGVMHEKTFRLTEREGSDRYKFVRELDRVLAEQAVATLDPPLEYHDFRNDGTETARTIHIYGGKLTRCQTFVEDGDGWWSAKPIEFSYD